MCGEIGFGVDEWVAPYEYANASIDLQYAHAFMFALVATVGIGYDVRPQRGDEIVFTTACIILGMFFVSATVIASVTSLLKAL